MKDLYIKRKSLRSNSADNGKDEKGLKLSW